LRIKKRKKLKLIGDEYYERERERERERESKDRTNFTRFSNKIAFSAKINKTRRFLLIMTGFIVTLVFCSVKQKNARQTEASIQGFTAKLKKSNKLKRFFILYFFYFFDFAVR
jgi:lipoprotein signal peptidase